MQVGRSRVDSTADQSKAHVSVRGAAFIGIGSMVGAGIFALLGQAAVIAGSAVWLSFLLAGARHDAARVQRGQARDPVSVRRAG